MSSKSPRPNASVKKSDPLNNSMQYNFLRSSKPSAQIGIDGKKVAKVRANDQSFDILKHAIEQKKKREMQSDKKEESFAEVLHRARDENSREKLK